MGRLDQDQGAPYGIGASSILLPKIHILCVDDDNDVCEIVRIVLQRSNVDYDITSAHTAEEGLTLAASRAFDLYVLDYHYRYVSGIEICRQLRQTDAHTPILFFAGEIHAPERRKAMEAGADA